MDRTYQADDQVRLSGLTQAMDQTASIPNRDRSQNAQPGDPKHQTASKALMEYLNADEILTQLNNGELLVVSSRRKNGLIIYKDYYAEFAGPGAIVGGLFDQHCTKVIPVGNLSLLYPKNEEERQNAYRIRMQWIRLTKRFTDNESPQQRAQTILEQFVQYFDQSVTNELPDESLAMLVGVFPRTIRMAR